MLTINKLEDLCDEIVDCPHSTPNWLEKGIPVIRNYNIVNGMLNKEDLSYVDEETYMDRTRRATPGHGDLIISREAPMGAICMVPENFKCCLGQRLVLLRPNSKICDPRYLLYVMQSDFVQKQINAIDATGSIVSNLNISDLKKLEIPIFGIQRQWEIANIIEKYDKSLEIIDKEIKMIEDFSSKLYSYWFLQFEFPDKNSKPYASNGGIIEDELPIGWTRKNLLDEVNWCGGAQPPKSVFINESKDGYVRFIQNRDYSNENYITYIPVSKKNKICTEFDIMMDKYGDAGKIRYGIEGAYNVALSKIDVLNKNMREYIRSYLNDNNIYNYLHNASMASTRASLSEENLSFLNISIPNVELLKKYENIQKKYIIQIMNLREKKKVLIKIKNTILPLLVNGELNLKYID